MRGARRPLKVSRTGRTTQGITAPGSASALITGTVPSRRGENPYATPASRAAGPGSPTARATRLAPSQATISTRADHIRWDTQSDTCSQSLNANQVPWGNR